MDSHVYYTISIKQSVCKSLAVTVQLYLNLLPTDIQLVSCINIIKVLSQTRLHGGPAAHFCSGATKCARQAQQCQSQVQYKTVHKVPVFFSFFSYLNILKSSQRTGPRGKHFI